MSELPGLFQEYSDTQIDDPRESNSAGVKLVIGVVVTGLVVAGGAIAYFGIGPMLAQPYSPPIQSNAPDIADVLGLNNAQQNSGLTNIVDQQLRQQLLQRLASDVSIPSGEQVSVLQIEQVPQHNSDSLFASAIKGDVLFVLQQAGTTYLYRPAEDKIIASGTVAAGE